MTYPEIMQNAITVLLALILLAALMGLTVQFVGEGFALMSPGLAIDPTTGTVTWLQY